MPIRNRLGQYGLSYNVGYVIYICTNGDVHEKTQIKGTFADEECVDGYGMDAGSGDAGYALFRRGATYTITSSEATALDGAGYTVV